MSDSSWIGTVSHNTASDTVLFTQTFKMLPERTREHDRTVICYYAAQLRGVCNPLKIFFFLKPNQN